MLRHTRLLCCFLAWLLATAAPTSAARQIVDLHKLDAYFALFARDSNVPWRTTRVRLDTYSSAPVDFSVYAVSPGDVLTAGTNARPRAVDTARLHAVATWRFTPPGGYQFQSNEVALPLGSREGFFVVEARRGNVAEQVWVNRTRVGLVSKETPSGILLYGADLGTGRPFSHLRVQFVVNRRFVTRYTDAHGLIRWNTSPRPVFALAQWGSSQAFLSFFPQPPLPRTIVALRTDTAAVRAGAVLHVVGYARTRSGTRLRATRGVADVTFRNGPALIARRRVQLDKAGAFVTAIPIPANARAGSYALLANVDGAIGSVSVHVDADANGLALSVGAACGNHCDASHPVMLDVRALRDGRAVGDLPVGIAIVRAPHAYTPANDERSWGTTAWQTATLQTDGSGRARIEVAQPQDGLASTYGVRVAAGGATAVTRVLVPTSRAVLRLAIGRTQIALGTPVDFTLDAWDAHRGDPIGKASVTVTLTHGPSVQKQVVELDENGHAEGSFNSAELGTSLASATLVVAGRTAMDDGQVTVSPLIASGPDAATSAQVHIELSHAAVIVGQKVHIDARLPGAVGDALVTFESALGSRERIVATHGGRAVTTMIAHDAPGALSLGVTFVRDGALAWNALPLDVDAPGRPVALQVARVSAQAPGTVLTLPVRGIDTPGTLVVRITRGEPTGAASFNAAPAQLAVGLTTTQTSAPSYATWHPWVDSSGQHARVLGFVRRTLPPQQAQLVQSPTQAVIWRIERVIGTNVIVPLPKKSGTYTLSVLKIADDGRVGALRMPLDIR